MQKIQKEKSERECVCVCVCEREREREDLDEALCVSQRFFHKRFFLRNSFWICNKA